MYKEQYCRCTVVRTSICRCTSDGFARPLVLLIYVHLSTKYITTINRADFDEHVPEEKETVAKIMKLNGTSLIFLIGYIVHTQYK